MHQKPKEQLVDDLIEQLREELPLMWVRPRTTELTGGVVNHRTLANAMSRGEGPEGTFMRRKQRIIVREPFLSWLRPQIQPQPLPDSK